MVTAQHHHCMPHMLHKTRCSPDSRREEPTPRGAVWRGNKVTHAEKATESMTGVQGSEREFRVHLLREGKSWTSITVQVDGLCEERHLPKRKNGKVVERGLVSA